MLDSIERQMLDGGILEGLRIRREHPWEKGEALARQIRGEQPRCLYELGLYCGYSAQEDSRESALACYREICEWNREQQLREQREIVARLERELEAARATLRRFEDSLAPIRKIA